MIRIKKIAKYAYYPVFLLALLAAWILLSQYFSVEDYQTVRESSRGVTRDQILIGSVSALGGHASFLGSEYLRGAQTYLDKINEEGGIHGRKIEIIAYDDQYDPAKTVFYTQKLINEDKVFALFNYVGTPTGVKVIPIVKEARIPLLGLFTGADAFRHPVQDYIFNVRASYFQEVGTFIKGVVEELGINKVAVFYQFDAYGLDGLKGAELALAEYGLKPVVSANYQRGTLNVEEALKVIRNSRAEAVVMIGTYSPMAKFISLARAEGFNPIFQNVSFVGSEALAKELGKNGDGVVVTEVVPPPLKDSSLSGAKEYISLLNKYFPGAEPSFGGLEGFLNAVVLVNALERAGADLSREKFIAALEEMKDFPTGLDSNVNFSKNSHQGMDKVYLTYIKDGRFNLFEDFNRVKDINRETETEEK